MNETIKVKIIYMVVLVGLTMGVNAMFPGTAFMKLFDIIAFATIIVLLYGVRKDAGRVSTSKNRKKIFGLLIGLTIALTWLFTQIIPKPEAYAIGFCGFILLAILILGYKKEIKG
jgi:hypothetical protein